MRGLVEPDCGGVNPLVRLTNRYTADRARVAEGVGTSRQAGQDGRVSSQGLVRKLGHPLMHWFYIFRTGSRVPGGDEGCGREADSHIPDGFPPVGDEGDRGQADPAEVGHRCQVTMEIIISGPAQVLRCWQGQVKHYPTS